jgi:hypothetical protein
MLKLDRVPIEPMRDAIRKLRLRAEPSNRLTLARLKMLAHSHPGEVFVEEVGRSLQGRPIHRVIVARDAPDRLDESGGHLSLHNQHGPENTAASAFVVAQFLQPLMAARHPVFGSDEFVYRAYVSTDVDGHEMNGFHGRRFHPRRFLKERERSVGLRTCTDYEMPLVLDAYDSAPRPESRSVSELIDSRRPDSISSHHRFAWGRNMALANQYDDPGLAYSLSAILSGHGVIADFDVDFPQSLMLAPGVFRPTRPAHLAEQGLMSIPAYLEDLGHQARYVLIDTCNVDVRGYDDTEQTAINGLHTGTNRIQALREPFVDELFELPLDGVDRRQKSVADWLELVSTEPSPQLWDFVPADRNPSAIASPTDLFHLTDYRVWVELGRLAQAANVALSLDEKDLHDRMWSCIDNELEVLERTRGFVEIPPERAVSAGAEAELLTLAGGLAWSFLDFGDEITRAYTDPAVTARVCEDALSR